MGREKNLPTSLSSAAGSQATSYTFVFIHNAQEFGIVFHT